MRLIRVVGTLDVARTAGPEDDSRLWLEGVESLVPDPPGCREATGSYSENSVSAFRSRRGSSAIGGLRADLRLLHGSLTAEAVSRARRAGMGGHAALRPARTVHASPRRMLGARPRRRDPCDLAERRTVQHRIPERSGRASGQRGVRRGEKLRHPPGERFRADAARSARAGSLCRIRAGQPAV